MQDDNSAIDNLEPSINRLERFQALQAGQYWRATQAIIKEGIDEGTVLLIESIRSVDDAPHTIILRPHPSKIGLQVYLEIPQDDGSIKKTWFKYNEHRFLLNDFLSTFEFEPDHQRIRTDEVWQVQGKINQLQTELLEAQSNPAILADVVEEKLQEQQANEKSENDKENSSHNTGLPAPVPSQNNNAVALARGSVSDAIGMGITAESIALLKEAANREHQIATIKSKWIQGKTTQIAETIKAMTPYYEEQAAAALAQTEDVRTYVAKLMQGIESLDLYVGKDVEVIAIRVGESAPKDVPLTFVQKKLMMDEELAVWADVDEWFDFSKESLFFEALREHDGLVNQIFPTERCVLVMATTRRHIDYGDKWANKARNQENRKVFMLVRDGMNIHQVFSPVESHLGTARLFPTKDDQKNIFRGFDGRQIKFEDVAYTDKLSDHEKFALHYKRFLLLVCGLDHRLKLFGDFYDGPQSLNFVSMDFQEKYCRFLHDDDGTGLLPGEKRMPLSEWLEEKNSYLRSGSRVLCKWRELMNPDTAPGVCKVIRYDNYSFERRYTPKDSMDVAIAGSSGKDICVNVEVSGYSYSVNKDRIFNCKVNISKFKSRKWGNTDQAFLCLDAVQPEELHWYIHNRDARSDHISYIRFFKNALKHIRQELVDQQDTRQRLAQALVDGNIAAPDERENIINQAVIAWRAANRGKPLPAFHNGEAPASWRSLLDQMYMLAGEGQRKVAEIEAFVHSLGYQPLRLVLSGAAKLVVYAAPSADECDDRLEPHAWVHRITVEKGKTKYLEKVRRWVSLPKQAASETTLHQWEGATEWCDRQSAFPSFERKADMMAKAGVFKTLLKAFVEPMSQSEFLLQLQEWYDLRERILLSSKYVLNPSISIPFGLIYYKNTKEFHFLCIGYRHAHALLYRMAPDDSARETIRNAYIKPYDRKEKGRSNFGNALAEKASWQLEEATISLMDAGGFGYIYPDKELRTSTLSGKKNHNPLLSDWLSNWRKGIEKYANVWFAEGVFDGNEHLVLDDLVGNKLPDDYAPVKMYEITLRSRSGEVVPKYPEWFDIFHIDDFGGNKQESLMSLVEDYKPKDLAASSDPEGVFITQTQVFTLSSPREARERIDNQLSQRYAINDVIYRAIKSTELADAPQPPKGVERWFVVED